MMNSFHHMPPTVARDILHSAQKNKEAILIYEIAENKIPLLVWWALLPISLTIVSLMALILTLRVRPVRIMQWVFTYCIPIIPLCFAWDGQASMVRMYTFEDIKELIGDPNQSDYEWRIEQAKKRSGKSLGYYILGLPK